MQFKKAQAFILHKLQNELPKHLTYHNIDHTQDVFDAARNIAIAEGVSSTDQKLLFTAALFHDSGFLKLRREHEAESCDIARKYLPDYKYTPEQIELICNMIKATRIPQSPDTLLEKILCDADLDYLGRDDFFALSDRLYKELCFEGLIKDKDDWNMEQVEFMTAHAYHTQTAVKQRQQKKEQYINLVKSKI